LKDKSFLHFYHNASTSASGFPSPLQGMGAGMGKCFSPLQGMGAKTFVFSPLWGRGPLPFPLQKMGANTAPPFSVTLKTKTHLKYQLTKEA